MIENDNYERATMVLQHRYRDALGRSWTCIHKYSPEDEVPMIIQGKYLLVADNGYKGIFDPNGIEHNNGSPDPRSLRNLVEDITVNDEFNIGVVT